MKNRFYTPIRLEARPERCVLMLCWALLALFLTACDDTDTFGDAGNRTLTFAASEVDLGLVFSGVPSPTKDIWVYNRSGQGLVCSEVRLAHGNQTGFRVNVDGWYLGAEAGYRLHDVEIASGDSIRIFVELTSHSAGQEEPREVSDNLIFTLQGGGEQQLPLKASTWDAVKLDSYNIATNKTIQQSRPVLIEKTLTVAEGATLTIGEGTTLYFSQDAGIDVYGTLICNGTAENNVTLRGDRLDNMFDYLPYDHLPGQWHGIHIYPQSVANQLTYTDIHSCYNGIVVEEPSAENVSLALNQVTIHNCQGYGLLAHNATVTLVNTQITNTLNDCVLIDGGNAILNACTLAQFYPFDSNRGAAIRFSNDTYPLTQLLCWNTLITGYADDVMMGERQDNGNAFSYTFANSIIRTPEPAGEEAENFPDCLYEDTEDAEKWGTHHFALIDTENLVYDFHLSEESPAIGKASAETSPTIDRDGQNRDDAPDIGAYEYFKTEE